jgi:hypothetical protein
MDAGGRGAAVVWTVPADAVRAEVRRAAVPAARKVSAGVRGTAVAPASGDAAGGAAALGVFAVEISCGLKSLS